jgi:hypothetical protein
MSLESWKSVADWATIIFIALTVVSGSAALILGDRINEKQTEQLRKFNEDLTNAKTGLSQQQERAAKAETELAEVKKKQAPRWIAAEQFAAAFGKARPGKVLIQYQSGNPEIAMFASGSIAPALAASGWHLVDSPRPIPSAAPQGVVAAMSEVFLYTSMKGNPSDPLSPIGGLNKAFADCGFRPTILGNDGLPIDTVLVVIGPKI